MDALLISLVICVPMTGLATIAFLWWRRASHSPLTRFRSFRALFWFFIWLPIITCGSRERRGFLFPKKTGKATNIFRDKPRDHIWSRTRSIREIFRSNRRTANAADFT